MPNAPPQTAPDMSLSAQAGRAFDYPGMQKEIAQEGLSQMGQGLSALREPTGGDALGSISATLRGLGNLAGGAVQYAGSPAWAATRMAVGRPLEAVGIPKEYSEFAANLALPLPKGVPRTARAEAEIPTTKQLLADYGTAKAAPELATEISPESAASNIGAIRAKLKDELHPTTGDTHSVLNQLEELAQGDSPLTMRHMQSANERLNEIIQGGGRDRSAALTTKPMFDEWMKGLAETGGPDAATAQGLMQDSRTNYSVGKAAEGLDKRLATAERKPTSTQMQTAMRTKVSQFLDSKDSQNLSLSQRAALDSFANGTATQGTLRFLGTSLGGSGGLPAIAAGALGHLAAGPAGLALPVVGAGLNRLSAALTVRQANKLSELIRSESPLARQMRGPIGDWSSAAEAAQGAPTASNLSRLTLASRNLSNNLKDANIHIAPNDIMKSLFGKPAEADEPQRAGQ